MHRAKKTLRSAVKFSLALLVSLTSVPCFGAALPAGFTETVVATMMGSPTAMEFSPDNKLFITQQNGIMPVWQNGSQLSANFFANTPLTTDTTSERGLLGVTFDPNFASNRYVYVYYTILGGDHHNRVSRFTADTSGNLAVAGSEAVIWEGDAHSAGNHNGGAVHFGPDGKLYLATGDNAQGSTVAQSLTSQHGKILRINADGTIPLDNPFHDSVGPNRDTIWSLGLRNPFTFAFQPDTGRMFVNDVGQNTWEEINDGGSLPSGRGVNYGWATTEGDFNPTSFPAFRRPFFAYHHSSSVSTPSGNVITGGAFYNPSTNTYGSDYLGDFFFADLGSGWIYRIDTATKVVTQFATGAGAVDLKVNNDGSLYYLGYGSKKVFKVTFAGSNSPIITTQPQNQTAGTGSQVAFTVEAPSGRAFQWQRSDNGGARWGAITGATSRTLTFTAAATDHNALFRLRVATASSLVISDAARLTLRANNAPNDVAVTFTGGLTGGKFVAGQPITFSGRATDPEDGPLGANRFSWTINYLTSVNQGDQDNDGMPGLTRPFTTLNGVTSGSFTPATTGPYTLDDVAYAVTLVVTDNQGLTATRRTAIPPQTSTITLATNPTGLNLTRDTQPVTAPNSFSSVVGFQRPIGAPPNQTVSGTNYVFTSWSDAGSADHTIVTPAVNTLYTAAYSVSASTLPAPWASTDIGAVRAAGNTASNSGTFTVNGSGSLRGNADAFQFLSMAANGDCSITARVATLPAGGFSGTNALAGVMIRSTLTEGSLSYFFGLRPRSTPQIVYRTRVGRDTGILNAGTGLAPTWLRLTRVGNTLKAFRSLNGVQWSQTGSLTLALGSAVQIGLAVCSDSAGLQAATFDNVTANP